MILQLEHIAKSFGGRTLFSGVNLRLEQFDRLALVGPNGAGKTTLLNIISGEEYPDEGKVVIAKGAQVGYLEQEAIEMGVRHTGVEDPGELRAAVIENTLPLGTMLVTEAVLRDCVGLEVVERDIPLRFDEAGRLLN